MKTFLFLGDSITDSHRLWQPENNGLGDGYVKILSDISMKKSLPDIYINKGHDGFTLSSLYRNLPIDCYPCHPDIVTILIGINDIAVARNSGFSFEPEKFAQQYDRLLSQILAHTHAKLLCIAPFIFPHPQEFSLWIPDIIQTEKIISDLADKYSFPFLPLQSYLNNAAIQKGYSKITLDGIHLTFFGHQLIAARWMETAAKHYS